MVPQVILTWLKSHKKIAAEYVFGVCLALSVTYGLTLREQNKKLSEKLNYAQNNIEAYQGIVNDALDANNVLKMDIETIKASKDSILVKMESVMRENKVKPKYVNTAATQTQTLDVSQSKGVGGQIVLIKDTVYTDSMLYNNLTKVYYSIGNDSINIRLNVNNTQYLYTFKTRVYKNNKSFFKRLFTLDFKKVDRYKYKLINTNDLLKESEIRIIER